MTEADILMTERKYKEAIEKYKKELEDNPQSFHTHTKLASCYAGINDLESALNHIKWSASWAPGNGDTHFTFSAIRGMQYRYDLAIQEANTALKLMPDHPNALWNKALFSLALGDYKTGYKLYRSGYFANTRYFRNDKPWGTPKDWKGKVLHIHSEQGAGDTFMLARLLRYIREEFQPAVLIFEVSEELLPIFFNHEYCDIVYKKPFNHYMPYECDYSLSLWDLLYVLHDNEKYYPFNLQSDPMDVYLDPSLLESVRKYSEEQGWETGELKIGFCYAGNPKHENDKNRSSTFQEFVEPFLDLPKSKFFVLQYDVEESDSRVISLGQELANWAITGAYLSLMDVVVTVDTGIAHLASILNKPTYIICPFANEWRWGWHPDEQGWKSDWYLSNPTFVYRQIFRQDWSYPVSLVKSKLENTVTWRKTTQPGQLTLML